ncbi:purine-nucleoside phosphorylase [Pseudolysinimonas sp.]|uniref:purine-nucleoside phosphorylase n=1 Tax=Pseudolysinimonas sp. TaxID=2680009 RepID=UPI002869ECBC|nr:purine-nucleoside phosphorylase [Pseudolysinimonas sp.]
MATPHIAASPGDFAPVVLMPGDPRRARRIAEELFDDARLVTEVRGILGFTGTYQGREVSVLASGMGGPSIAIYATELARFYGVTRIVRVGTAGGLQPGMPLGTVVAASAAHTDSAMTTRWVPGVALSAVPSFGLLAAAVAAAERDAVALQVGPVFTSDTFYGDEPGILAKLGALGTLAAEMETATLYAVGAKEGIETLALVTVTDDLIAGQHLSADERETGFGTAARLALAAALT